MREKLIELLKSGGVRDFPFNAALADHLIANGVGFREQDCHWATEQAYKNGYAKGKADALKWIPVTERLPEKGTGKVLVVKQFRGRSYVDIGEVIEGRAYCYSDEYCIKAREHILTHWMPLPEPPKGE